VDFDIFGFWAGSQAQSGGPGNPGCRIPGEPGPDNPRHKPPVALVNSKNPTHPTRGFIIGEKHIDRQRYDYNV
jgi:hypothetical protein